MEIQGPELKTSDWKVTSGIRMGKYCVLVESQVLSHQTDPKSPTVPQNPGCHHRPTTYAYLAIHCSEVTGGSPGYRGQHFTSLYTFVRWSLGCFSIINASHKTKEAEAMSDAELADPPREATGKEGGCFRSALSPFHKLIPK